MQAFDGRLYVTNEVAFAEDHPHDNHDPLVNDDDSEREVSMVSCELSAQKWGNKRKV